MPRPKLSLSDLTLKARLRIIAVSLLAVAYSHTHFVGVDSGIHAIDQQAFDAQVEVATQLKIARAEIKAETHNTHKVSHETHKAHDTVWAALAMRGK